MRRRTTTVTEVVLTVLCVLALVGLLDSSDARCVGDDQPSFCAE
jgi:hypothetical protein